MSDPTGPRAIKQATLRPPRALLAGALAAGIALAIDLATTRPFVLPGDPGEFQTMARVGGIAHGGYAPVVLLLRLFGLLPVSTVAFRANLLSCLAGATATGLAAFVSARLCGGVLPAVIAAVAFALGRTPWKESTEAGVHTVALAMQAGAFVLAIRFLRTPDRGGAFWIGLLGGLALLSHVSTLSLLPVVLFVAIMDARAGRLRAAHGVAALFGLALGLSPIGYMLKADRPDQPMNYLEDVMRLEPAEYIVARPVPATRIERTLWLLSSRQYYGADRPQARRLADRTRRALELAAEVAINQYPLWGLVLACVGAWALARHRASALWMIGLWVLSAFALAVISTIGWFASYFFLPGLWGVAILIAVGLEALRQRSRLMFAAAALLLVAMPCVRLAMPRAPGPLGRRVLTSVVWARWPKEWSPLRPDRSWEEYAREVMRSLPPRAAVMTWWAEGNALRYFCYAEPLRPDVRILPSSSHPGRVAHAVALARAEGRPVFATFPADSATPIGLAFTRTGQFSKTGLWRVESRAVGR